MTKNEFLSRLEAELEARRVPEPEDILGEYRRHFEYKLADGYSEEEIAARLGAPEELAAQFEPEREAPHPSRAGSAARSALTWTGLGFADMFVLSFLCYLPVGWRSWPVRRWPRGSCRSASSSPLTCSPM